MECVSACFVSTQSHVKNIFPATIHLFHQQRLCDIESTRKPVKTRLYTWEEKKIKMFSVEKSSFAVSEARNNKVSHNNHYEIFSDVARVEKKHLKALEKCCQMMDGANYYSLLP